jgi:capsular exopolysaccharide synthesis family protein
MSSIRDALRRAERERLERESGGPRVASSHAQAERHAVEREPARGPESTFDVVSPPPIPSIEIPVDFAQELAYFRQGVESALPQKNRSILLTSATSSEGVSTLALYIAFSLAIRDNKTTCLIDGSFESPSVSNTLGLLGKPGLSDYLSNEAELRDVLLRTESPSLHVMGIGTHTYNPSLLLSGTRARSLVADLSERFEYVLIDSAGVLAHAETSMLAAYVDGVVLVVRAQQTKREVLAKADRLIRFSGGKVIGSILNRRKFPIPQAIYRRL